MANSHEASQPSVGSQSNGQHVRKRNRGKAPAQAQALPAQNTEPISFEAKIAMALQGASWQELQNSSTAPAESLPETLQPLPSEIEEASKPPELTEKQKKKRARFDATIARDAGDVLQTIEALEIVPVEQEVTWDQDPELLCSYNWQASTDHTNTIFEVPGAPAKWHPQELPHTLVPDSGFEYTDYNYVRQPRQPYSPMFSALSLMKPDYQFNTVDVLADRNNLRVLLEFASGRANGPFRLDLHTIFDTLVIVRNESKWWTYSDGKSYGCNFERAFTRPAEGMEDATSHYRAIRYSMGPLSVVCRFEADAYDEGITTEPTGLERVAAVGGLSERPRFSYNAPIRVLQKGHIVPTAQMVELKTQTYYREKPQSVQCQDQLWFGRTKLLYTGPYEPGTGVLERIKYEDATERVKRWEEKNQTNLRKLVALLAQLKAIMKKERRPNRAVVLVREDKGGPLTIRSMEGMRHAVSLNAFQRHWRREAPQHTPSQRGQWAGVRYVSGGGLGRGVYGGQHFQSEQGQGYATSGRGGFSAHGRSVSYRGAYEAYDGRGGSSTRGAGLDHGRGSTNLGRHV